MLVFARRYCLLFIAGLAAIGSVYSAVRTRVAATPASPQSLGNLICEASEHDFGVVPQLETLTTTFRLTNQSTSDLSIQNVRTECGCTATKLGVKQLGPGESTTLSVSLRTDVLSGLLRKRVWVDHRSLNPSMEPELLTLVIEATVKPDYRAEPASLLFNKGQSQQRELLIVPEFESHVKVKNAECNSEAVTVELVESDLNAVSQGGMRLRLSFDSSKWDGDRRSAIITVTTDSVRQPMLNVPVSVY